MAVGSQEGDEGEVPGAGGIGRGEADAPLFFGDQPHDLVSENLEPISNGDFSRAAVGEVIRLDETEREIEVTSSGPSEGGAIGSGGKGGEAVSREMLLPDEQAVLKRYFKQPRQSGS